MDYVEALKKVKAAKPPENYLIIEFSYSTKLVLPYKEGIALVASMTGAEKLVDDYNKPKMITGFARDDFTTRIMSRSEYQRHKVAALLNISADDLKEQAAAAEA